MIVINIEMWPKGDKTKSYPLGVMVIANDAKGTNTQGSYSYVASDKSGRPWKDGDVHEFPRKRLGAYDLLFRCLQKMVGSRNPK